MRYFTLFFLLLVQAYGWGQLQQGDRLLELRSTQFPTDYSAHPSNGGNLAQLDYYARSPAVQLSSSLTYGWMLSNRLALGASVRAGAQLGERTYAAVSLSPYLRYYLINTERLMAFGQVTSGAYYDNDQINYGGGIALKAGLHYPIAPGVLLSPAVSYVVCKEWSNVVSLGGGIALVLGRNNRPETGPVVQFERGDLLLGSQFVSFSSRRETTRYGVDLGGYYFLTSRVAVGGSIGADRSRSIVNLQPTDNRQTSFDVSVGTAVRYHLTTGRRLGWFSELGGSYTYLTAAYPDGSDFHRHLGSATLGIGAQFFVRDNVSLELVPQVRHQFSKYAYQSYAPRLNFGIRFLL